MDNSCIAQEHLYKDRLPEQYLGFECNFRFLQMAYFGCQGTISALSA